jgi:predicted RecB family nuclease
VITASQLYNHVNCPRRVELDLHGDPSRRDAVSAFVQLLWERGSAFEAEVVVSLPGDAVLLGGLTGAERQHATMDAIKQGAQLIHGGRITADDLLGDPDLLIRVGDRYVAADIKSGRGDEGGDEERDGRPKAHYAVQVALYTDILERLGLSAGREAEIWDSAGERITYDLEAPRHAKTSETWWSSYQATRDAVAAIAAGASTVRGAMSSACGLCHWRTVCRAELIEAGDLTLIPGLGRTARDAMLERISCLTDFAAADPETFMEGKKTCFAGVGADRLRLFHSRAVMLTSPSPRPYLRDAVSLPDTHHEIFFDIEADPMRDNVYLHGFVERWGRSPDTERFTAFFAATADAEGERQAFADAVEFLRSRPEAAIYYYSKYERTTYRRLQRLYPEVCTAEEIEALFEPPRSIDLYFDVVFRATEWPTHSQSIKALAKHLGFSWRDTDPSGAASIEWYHRWCETGDPQVRQRILDYNEDDCRATIVLLDAVRDLPFRSEQGGPK